MQRRVHWVKYKKLVLNLGTILIMQTMKKKYFVQLINKNSKNYKRLYFLKTIAEKSKGLWHKFSSHWHNQIDLKSVLWQKKGFFCNFLVALEIIFFCWFIFSIFFLQRPKHLDSVDDADVSVVEVVECAEGERRHDPDEPLTQVRDQGLTTEQYGPGVNFINMLLHNFYNFSLPLIF